MTSEPLVTPNFLWISFNHTGFRIEFNADTVIGPNPSRTLHELSPEGIAHVEAIFQECAGQLTTGTYVKKITTERARPKPSAAALSLEELGI